MRCPYCACDNTKVSDSRLVEGTGSIRRRRHCLACEERFTTFEVYAEPSLTVVKSNGDQERYSRNKIVRGLERACKKRRVSQEKLDELVAQIEKDIRVTGRKTESITSKSIGDLILARLKTLDDVAYIRYASVYKDFQTVDEFHKELSLLDNEPKELGSVDV